MLCRFSGHQLRPSWALPENSIGGASTRGRTARQSVVRLRRSTDGRVRVGSPLVGSAIVGSCSSCRDAETDGGRTGPRTPAGTAVRCAPSSPARTPARARRARPRPAAGRSTDPPSGVVDGDVDAAREHSELEDRVRPAAAAVQELHERDRQTTNSTAATVPAITSSRWPLADVRRVHRVDGAVQQEQHGIDGEERAAVRCRWRPPR